MTDLRPSPEKSDLRVAFFCAEKNVCINPDTFFFGHFNCRCLLSISLYSLFSAGCATVIACPVISQFRIQQQRKEVANVSDLWNE
ncbi:hypothetical protein [Pseudomonas koreensis]|uniref:hypothetical protein n=1 Tax=Pseudomonas koreensis TaxID=198620 RepID=UPI0014753F27|nr:hypothetical protein [Pseudomonas koreensis]NNA55043.1 hypothetical protein [Pseudomonas koreensis]